MVLVIAIILALNSGSTLLASESNAGPSATPGTALQYVPSGDFSHLRAELVSPLPNSTVESNGVSTIRIRAQGAPIGAILVVTLVGAKSTNLERIVLQREPSAGSENYSGVLAKPLPKGTRVRVRLMGFDKPCNDATDFPKEFRVCHPGPPPIVMVANRYYDIGDFATTP